MVDRNLRYWLNALLFGITFFATPLPAAIVQTGNVQPDIASWDYTTYGYVGNTSDGSVLVDAGSELWSRGGYLGYSSGATGTATITGAGSQWNINPPGFFPVDLSVGHEGTGTLTVADGGQVSSGRGYLGHSSGSTGTAIVTGAGSHWTNDADLYVGREGSGTLTVADGGEVTTGTLYASLADLQGDGTITAQGAVIDADLWFDAAHGTQAVTNFGSGGTLTVTGGEGDLGVGYRGLGSLTVADGIVVSSSNGYLGLHSGSTGTAAVTGVGSKWTNSSSLYVGRGGSGTLTVADGGQVTTGTLYASLADLQGDGTITATEGAVIDADLWFDAAHGTQAVTNFGSGGTLAVTGAGGTLGAGYKGLGSMTVADGVVVSSSSGYLGFGPGSTGTATVTGAGSKWTIRTFSPPGIASFSPDLYVGNEGSGTLVVEAGGQVNNRNGYLGFWEGSTGTAIVTGAGSKWTNSSFLYVGTYGSGTLTVADGGQVNSNYGYLGNSLGSTGTATVTGAGSQWTNSSGSFNVGSSGNGTLRVEAGGQVSSSSGVLGYHPGSTGTATVTGAGSKWITSSTVDIGRNGSGTLTITSGGFVGVGDTLTIDRYDPNGDSYINMATGGMLALKGDADDSLADFLNLVEGNDTIRYWDKSVLDWSPLTAAIDGTDYTLSYLTTGDWIGYTLLTVGQAGDSDFDGNGAIDGNDFLIWQRNLILGSLADWQAGYDPGPAGTDGDFDGNGTVDGHDFLAWQRNSSVGSLADWQANYGTVSSLAADSKAVPEPTSWLLSLLAAGGLVAVRRG